VYEHILIPLDHSPADEAILSHIRKLARLTGARLTLIHVADGFMARNQKRLGLDESSEMRDDRDYLEKRVAELAADGFKVRAILECGEPADHILAIADREACDLIAMSTHGHRFLSDLILGSVAEQVRHRTGIPVLLIRAPKAN
jgi:nucleotide-binding universal stress UspA family protein